MFTPQHKASDCPETIEIEGIQRPTCDSRGRSIGGGDLDKLQAFWRWFGDSCVVDALRRPLVVYHGTASPTFTRDGTRGDFGTKNGMGEGAYFTPDPNLASDYARMDHEVGDGDAAVIPVYLSIENPYIFLGGGDSQSISPAQKNEFFDLGNDGVFGCNDDGSLIEIVVFHPGKIKSAIGNSGAYDPEDTRITDQFDCVLENTRKRRMQP